MSKYQLISFIMLVLIFTLNDDK